MKVEELRIGNYIKYVEKKFHLYKNIQVTAKILLYFSTIYYKSIPLTEQWVKDFGFKLMKPSEYTFDTYELNGIKLWEKESGIFIFRSDTHIKYVHQLQNLYFVLTNIELTKQK